MEDEEEASSPSKSPTRYIDQTNDEAYDANAQIDAVASPIEAEPPQSPAAPPAPIKSPPPPPNTTVSSPSKRPGLGHRSQGSAESISYCKDEDKSSGGTRWVMERRRTAESGEIEILGREVVTGGSI
jgi:hypothetical protein